MTTAPVSLHLLTGDLSPRYDLPAWLTWTRLTGQPGIEIPAHIATPADHIGGYEMPEATFTGVVCGHCTDDRAGWIAESVQIGEEPTWTDPTVRHASVDHVARCWYQRCAMEDEARAEAPLIRMGIL
jgi:hypothetical protein